MEICKFVHQNNSEINQCRFRSKYGGYCSKHKRNYLIDDDNLIIRDRFTGKQSDYLVKDLANYYHLRIDTTKQKHKKQFYFDEICKFIHSLDKYDTEKIIKIQSLIRRYFSNQYKRCNNDEDFYTYDPLHTIERRYFYTYKDLKNFYWGFDIRSLVKLLNTYDINPYTTEKIPGEVVQDIQARITNLQENGDFEDINNLVKRDKKELIKQKIVDLFSDIELSGYSCHIDWFIELSIRRLKELYKQLEDLWNFRLREFEETKRRLAPPNGRIFTTPITTVSDYDCKEDIQELILHDICKFKNIENDSDKKLGYMYFLICLSHVSPQCYTIHQQWISLAN